MYSALAEAGILYVTASVHQGWGAVGKSGQIKQSPQMTGGHAFALVGYDAGGFWLQNSWGPGWGRGGFAHLSYDDWLANGTDVWVARLGAPVLSAATRSGSTCVAVSGMSTEVRRAQLQQHTVAIGNNGLLRATGEVGNTQEDIERLLGPGGDFEKLTRGWATKRLLLYAHGGLVPEPDALQRVSEYLPALLASEVYPLAFIWKTDFWSTMGNLLKDAFSRRRPEGLLDTAKDFMLDRLDDTLELLAQVPGRLVWNEMKENAVRATEREDGGARLVLELLLKLLERQPNLEVHFAGHSAGSIFLGPLLRQYCEAGKRRPRSTFGLRPAPWTSSGKIMLPPSSRARPGDSASTRSKTPSSAMTTAPTSTTSRCFTSWPTPANPGCGSVLATGRRSWEWRSSSFKPGNSSAPTRSKSAATTPMR